MLLDTVKITESNRIDPTAYLEGRGFTVRREGRHLSVRAGGDERYRITQNSDGRWVACDKTGQGIGDNIALVRDLEPALGFLEAVARLAAGPVIQREPIPEPRPGALVPPAGPRPAPTARPGGSTCKGGASRWIRWITPSGRVSCATPGAACGSSGGMAKGHGANVSQRLIAPGADEKPKRDLAGSDQTYPPILPGNPRVVWIVEGGVDALATRDLALRRGKVPPTVLVSGGATVGAVSSTTQPCKPGCCRPIRWSWCGTTNARNSKQAETDAAHDRQIARIRELRGTCADWRPPVGVKDVAELNLREQGAGVGRWGAKRSPPATDAGGP